MHAYDDREFSMSAAMKAVWIVDDDRSIRWVLEKALAREGIPFKTFASVVEVMQALQHSLPQVLVSDIRMPGESGLALLTKIKERHPRVPVIIMTAHSDLDRRRRGVPGRSLRILAEAVRRRSCDCTDPPGQRRRPCG
jgi:two-component system nitrogen regulation response regulator GlnG